MQQGGGFVEGNYGVYFGDKFCGKVQVQSRGLYLRFVCRCQLTGDIICCLRAVFQDREENLGVLIPVDDGFGLTTQLPAKRFAGELVQFRIAVKQEGMKNFFAPIYPEEPFGYLEMLKSAFLTKRNGQIGVMIKTK